MSLSLHEPISTLLKGETTQAHPVARRAIDTTIALTALYAILTGLVLLAAWAFNLPRLASFDSSGIVMQPNTALLSLLAGVSLLLVAFASRRLAGVLAIFVALGGVATLVQHIFSVDLGIDRLLLFNRDWGTTGTVAPGRMGVPASLSYVLLGVGLALASLPEVSRIRRSFACALAFVAAAIGFLSIVGYLLGADRLYSLPRLTAIAFQSATVVLALAIGLIASLREQLPVLVLSERSAAGILARRALPLIIIVPVLLGWLRTMGVDAGLYDVAFGTALRTVVEVGLFLALLAWAVALVRAQELRLRANAEFNRSIIESSRDSIMVLDLKGNLLSINAAGREQFGARLIEENLNRPSIHLWAPQHQDAAAAALSIALTGNSGLFTGLMTTPAGEEKWWEVTVSPMTSPDGAPERLLAIARDISDRMRTHETRARLAAIVEASDDAIISKTLEGIIVSWNSGAERLFGYSASEAIGRSIELIVPPEGRADERGILHRLSRGERIAHFDTERVAKSGERLQISLTVSPVRDASGVIIGASKVARDITAMKQVQAELRQHREHLQQLVMERTEQLEISHRQLRAAERINLLGTLSAGLGHDMGNLLIPIRIRLDSLAQYNLPENAHDDLSEIRTSVEYLQRLANGLRLLVSDPEKAHPGETLDLHTWWKDAQGVMRSVLPARVTLDAAFAPSDRHVAMSKVGLTQLIFNLIQNAGDALRSKETGHVVVRSELHADTVTISVSDNGSGMTPEVKARCLDPFFTTKARGISSGLGLVLVQGIVRSAGGRVEFDSEIGKGTTFTITLPLAPRNSAAQTGASTQRTAVVDIADNRLRSFLSAEIRARGFRVLTPAEGAAIADLVILNSAASLTSYRAEAKVIILSSEPATTDRTVFSVGPTPPIAALREAIRSATASHSG